MQKKKKKLGTEVKEIALCQKKQNETATCYLYLPRETVLDRNYGTEAAWSIDMTDLVSQLRSSELISEP